MLSMEELRKLDPLNQSDRALIGRCMVAKMAQPFFANESTCFRCGLPSSVADRHITWHSESQGLGPLCYTCFEELGPKSRLPFYMKWADEAGCSEERRREIEVAVLEGK